MNTFCLVLDGLQAAYLGPYGNSWVGTPHFNQLASESWVFDQAFIDAADLEHRCRSQWQGLHAMAAVPEGAPRQTLAARLTEAGITTILASDAEELLTHPLAEGFGERLRIGSPHARHSSEPADAIEDSALGAFFADLAELVNDLPEPCLLWAHSSALVRCWDAPRAFRDRYADAEAGEEAPAEFSMHELMDHWGVTPPSGVLEADADPDEWLALRWNYAAQVALLDACLGALWEEFSAQPAARRTALALWATRGYPLGEHRRLGLDEPALHEELIHVPCLVRPPGGLAVPGRSSALVQPADVYATLAELWKLPRSGAALPPAAVGQSLLPILRGESAPLRDRIGIRLDAAERAIRTAAWYLREVRSPIALGEARRELYAKPDDRWEQNDVASRLDEHAQQLGGCLLDFERVAASRLPAELAPLPAFEGDADH